MFLTECPRDAMQGIKDFIPTDVKIEYLNQLLRCGFDTLDFGSFVSPKAIPQLSDTQTVYDNLDLESTNTKLLAIIANLRGAETALKNKNISFLGFPLSISETFQQRNTNKSINESIEQLKIISDLCDAEEKGLVIYLSMAFGNPYGDKYNQSVLDAMFSKAVDIGCSKIMLSDTIGSATTSQIESIYKSNNINDINVGLHLHTLPDEAFSKVKTSYESGCKYIDSAIGGFGGCPMAKDDLTGNMPTESVLTYLMSNEINHDIDIKELTIAKKLSDSIFSKYA
ncbi:MAG: hydroxymethylglutaryl-CoA lyase [Candidatus Kapaibacteriales bacterium]